MIETESTPGQSKWAIGSTAFAVSLREVSKDRLDGQRSFRTVVPLTKGERADRAARSAGPALCRLVSQDADEEFVAPRIYLQAASEATFCTIATCWGLTLLFNEEFAFDSPLTNFLGYASPWAGWDVAPAQHVGLLGSSLAATLAWIYAAQDSARVRLLGIETWEARFSVWASYLHSWSSSLMLLAFIVGPTDGNWTMHVLLLMQLVVCRFIAVIGAHKLATEAEQVGAPTAFIWTYGVLSLLLPALYFLDVLAYRLQYRQGVDPFIPWYVTMCVDYGWLTCLAATSSFMPKAAPMRIVREVLEEGQVDGKGGWRSSTSRWGTEGFVEAEGN